MRKYIRHPSDMPLECCLTTNHQCFQQDLKNVGEGGICFSARMAMQPGEAVHVVIPVSGEHFEADGVVVWCRRAGNSYDVGVCFNDAEAAFGVRMVEQLCHIEQYRKQVARDQGRLLTSEQAAIEWIRRFAGNFPSFES